MNVSTEQSIQLTLGPWYSKDGKYSNPTIPVYTIQKTRSDLENMVVVVCGEGYTKSQQGKFINDVKRLWQDAMKYEPYRSYADRFNVYALCTASESTFDNGGSTFFDVIIDKYNSPVISNNLHGSQWKNHIFERCIGPEFIEKIHDAHIKKTTDPNTMPSGSEYEPYYYVHDYIAQFAMVVNTKSDFGGAYNNREYGFHYFISSSDSYRASKTFAHEFGHGLLGLGDEYSNGYLLEDKELKSLNLSSVEDPEEIKWRQLLGFRNTYTCRNAYGSKMLVSSYECIMRDTNYQFCEVCRLQGFKRMSQLVKDVDLYVAPPEVKEYTGAYSKPSDFTDLETSSYYAYTYNRNGRLLSGDSKNKFGTNMNGKKIELRTVIQNISDKKARQLKFKMWIKHSDGSVAIDSSGNPLQTTQTFDIPVWDDKPNFWALGALDHIKSDFNSGLKSCSLIYQIPSDAQLKNGDTVAFQVIDENGNVLADDNTETQRYTTVTIQYKFEDGTEIPNTTGGTFTVPYGTKLDLTPAKTLYDYEFVKADGLNEPIVSDGTVITYYYKSKTAPEEKPAPVINTVSLSLESSITMNFKVFKNSLSSFDDFYMTFECGGIEEKVTQYKQDGNYYVFSYKGINPQLMNDKVTAVLHAKNSNGEYISPEKVISVREYAYTMLDRYSSDEHSKLRTLLVDLLNYGSATQKYMGYQTDNLANSDLTAVQNSWASKDTKEFKNIRKFDYKTITNPTVQWNSCGLVLGNSIMFKVKFTANNVENKTVEIALRNVKFTYDKNDFKDNGDGTYYVYCNELFAHEVSDEILLTVYENGVPCSNTMLFSVESYARLVRDNYKGTPLDEMITTMMLYGNSAKEYKAQTNV